MSDISGIGLSEGVSLLQSGQLAAAAEYFSNVVSRDAANGPAYGYLGIALTRLGQTEAALNALGQASQLQPTDPVAQYNVAIGLMHAGRQQEAVPFLQYTLQLNPNHAQAQTALNSIQSTLASAAAPPAPPAPQPEVEGSAANPAAPAAQAPVSGPVLPASPAQGMHYTRPAQTQVVQQAPDIGTRLLRGVGWGALFAQWWTIWTVGFLFYYGTRGASAQLITDIVLKYLALFTVSGVIAGIIIACAPPSITTAVAVTVAIGLIICAIEAHVAQSATMWFNVIFYFLTGRFIGARIAVNVHKPIPQ